MHEAAWREGARTAGPFTLSLDECERRVELLPGATEAWALAALAGGIVQAASGTVYVGAFDARVQPVHAKRLAGYVPHDALPSSFASFERYIEFRADLWGIPHTQAIVRARAVLERLRGMHEAFAFPLAGALCAQPKLLVVDRPEPARAPLLVAAAAGCALLTTHCTAEDARAFSRLPVHA